MTTFKSIKRKRQASFLDRRADQAGLLVAATSVPFSFQRTLMPRNTIDQALVTGLSFAANHAVVQIVQESVQAAALVALRRRRSNPSDAQWSKASILADAAVFAAGIAMQRRFKQVPREELPRAGARTAGYWLSLAAGAGAIIGTAQEVLGVFRGERQRFPVIVPAAAVLGVASEAARRHRERNNTPLAQEGKIDSVKAIGIGLGLAGGLSLATAGERKAADLIAKAAARVLPGPDALWRPIGHIVALAALARATAWLTDHELRGIERKETAFETAFDVAPPNPNVSGSAASTVPFATLSKQGRRFVWTVTTPDQIRAVMGERMADHPVRIYAGLDTASTEEERVAIVLDELDRTGAFEKSLLMILTPTGTGYVNYAAVSAIELLTRGNSACVAMQYAARPSVLSLDRVAEGRSQAHLLFEALSARLGALSPDRRPKVVLFGESLGAWASQDAFVDRGTDGLIATGIDYAIWIGTPHFSKWKEQVLFDGRSDVDRSLVGVFSCIEEWEHLSVEERAALRYVMITHRDDGVALFGPQLAIQAPIWLDRDRSRPAEVPQGMAWSPTTTFFQVLVDMKNSATVVPGVLAAKGHDYRADLLPFFHRVLGLDASEVQLERIERFLAEIEVERTDWISRHGAAGKGLAATLVERWMQDQRDQGEDADAKLMALLVEVARDEFHAAGGAGHLGTATTEDADPAE